MKHLTLCFCCLLCGLSVLAEELKPVLDQFDLAIEKLDLERELELRRISKLYRGRLEQLYGGYQRQGDLDALQEVIQEQKRLAENPLELPPVFSELPDLNQLQITLKKAFEDAHSKSAVKLEMMLKQIDAHLGNIQISQVQSGDIEAAQETKLARETLPEREDVLYILSWKRGFKPPHPDAKPYQGRHFLVVTEHRNYPDAEAWCKEQGGRLAVIPDQGTLDFILSILPQGSGRVYIGLTDRQQEGQWRWSNGKLLTKDGFNRWNPGEPNNSSAQGEHVAEMLENGLWNDSVERNPRSFICEWP